QASTGLRCYGAQQTAPPKRQTARALDQQGVGNLQWLALFYRQVVGDPQWLSSLFSRRLGKHPPLENTGLFHLVHHLYDLTVGHISISAEEDILIAAHLIERLQFWTQGIQRVCCLVKIDVSLLVHSQHHLIFRGDLWYSSSHREVHIQLMLQHGR